MYKRKKYQLIFIQRFRISFLTTLPRSFRHLAVESTGVAVDWDKMYAESNPELDQRFDGCKSTGETVGLPLEFLTTVQRFLNDKLFGKKCFFLNCGFFDVSI